MATTTAPGLRELKKQRTHRLLAETAWRLFADRGFEQVTVAEVARAAEVSEATARAQVQDMAHRLLSNPVIEDFRILTGAEVNG